MSEPSAEHLTSQMRTDANAAGRATMAAVEPPWALTAGGIAGALCFFLFALLFGARWAIGVAAVAAILALAKRMRLAAITLAVAGALSAIGLAPSVAALFIASLAFGAGLALAAREFWRRHASDAAR
jgi:hypothetical protein